MLKEIGFELKKNRFDREECEHFAEKNGISTFKGES